MKTLLETVVHLMDDLSGLNEDMHNNLYFYLTTSEVAALWCVSADTVHRWINDPHIVSRPSDAGYWISYISVVLVKGKPPITLAKFFKDCYGVDLKE